MSKPAGQIDFDQANSLLDDFWMGSTFSEYAGTTFKVESKDGDQVGSCANPLWVSNKGLQAEQNVSRPYFVDYPLPQAQDSLYSIVLVYELTGTPIDYGALLRINTGDGNSMRYVDSRDDYVRLRQYGNQSFVNQDISAIGTETVVVLRSNSVEAAPFVNCRSGNGLGADGSQGNNFQTATRITFLTAPDSALAFNVNAIVKMCFCVSRRMSDAEVDSIIADPWQVIDQGAPPVAAKSPLFFGQDF